MSHNYFSPDAHGHDLQQQLMDSIELIAINTLPAETHHSGVVEVPGRGRFLSADMRLYVPEDDLVIGYINNEEVIATDGVNVGRPERLAHVVDASGSGFLLEVISLDRTAATSNFRIAPERGFFGKRRSNAVADRVVEFARRFSD